MSDAEQLEHLISSIRAMAISSTTSRWVRFADIANWIAELMRLNGPLLRPLICGCGATETIERRRLPTCYQHEEDNWMTSCLTCYEETREQYQEWIKEYEEGLL